jgi:hypothetical protein
MTDPFPLAQILVPASATPSAGSYQAVGVVVRPLQVRTSFFEGSAHCAAGGFGAVVVCTTAEIACVALVSE